jgi:hypothetical protein
MSAESTTRARSDGGALDKGRFGEPKETGKLEAAAAGATAGQSLIRGRGLFLVALRDRRREPNLCKRMPAAHLAALIPSVTWCAAGIPTALASITRLPDIG